MSLFPYARLDMFSWCLWHFSADCSHVMWSENNVPRLTTKIVWGRNFRLSDDTTRQNWYFFVDEFVVECVESWKQCCCPRGQIYKCLSLNVKVLVNFWGLLSSAMRHTYKMLIIYELAWCYHAAKIFFLHKIMIYTFFALLDTFSRTLVGAVHKNQETAFSASIESRTPNASDSSIS